MKKMFQYLLIAAAIFAKFQLGAEVGFIFDMDGVLVNSEYTH